MYQVEFLPQAVEDLESLDKAVAQRVLKKIRWLAESFESVKGKPFTGPLGGLLKLRAGDYRIIYEANRERGMLTVHLIGQRRDIYERPT